MAICSTVGLEYHMMQIWYGPVVDDTLRYERRVGLLASCFEEAAELARRYYRPIIFELETMYAGHSDVKEYPIEVLEYSASMAPVRSDDWRHIPDIESVAGELSDKNPGVYMIMLERGSDVSEIAWGHEGGIRSKLAQNEVGVLFSRK